MIGKAAAMMMLAAATTAAAECSREDVDHYLDRGFSPDQVVSLCAGEVAGTSAGNERERLLRDAIAAMDVELAPDALRYTREQCIHYGPENLAQQRKKACGLVHYRIARAGLQVRDSRRKRLFWGSNAVEVQGAIERRYELGQAALDADDQRLLERELERGERTEIPAREGVSLERLRGALQEWAQR